MPMDLGTRNTLLCDFMYCMTAVSLEMSDEPKVSLLHIKGTQRERENTEVKADNITKVPKAQRATKP